MSNWKAMLPLAENRFDTGGVDPPEAHRQLEGPVTGFGIQPPAL